jgi:hypothetical protein
MSGRWVAVTGALALVLVPFLTGCGATTPKPASKAVPQTVKECRQKWHDVGESVLGLDQDTDPSALASRWTSVIATVDYYETSTSAQDCQERIENQVKAITALRDFSERLRPYDMVFQLERVSAAADLYLHDPVPRAVNGPNGKPVEAPTHRAVEAALATLTDEAVDADAELQPGWEHLASVTLEDDAAVTAALDDLDALARAGAHWTRCQQALQVIVAATRAQEGLLGTPEDQPSPSATATPTN